MVVVPVNLINSSTSRRVFRDFFSFNDIFARELITFIERRLPMNQSHGLLSMCKDGFSFSRAMIAVVVGEVPFVVTVVLVHLMN